MHGGVHAQNGILCIQYSFLFSSVVFAHEFGDNGSLNFSEWVEGAVFSPAPLYGLKLRVFIKYVQGGVQAEDPPCERCVSKWEVARCEDQVCTL